MSTKMSTDLNISRPTSRVSRPPGGHQTFSFGEYLQIIYFHGPFIYCEFFKLGESEPAKPVASPAKPYSNPITGKPTNFPPPPPAAEPVAAVVPPPGMCDSIKIPI